MKGQTLEATWRHSHLPSTPKPWVQSLAQQSTTQTQDKNSSSFPRLSNFRASSIQALYTLTATDFREKGSWICMLGEGWQKKQAPVSNGQTWVKGTHCVPVLTRGADSSAQLQPHTKNRLMKPRQWQQAHPWPAGWLAFSLHTPQTGWCSKNHKTVTTRDSRSNPRQPQRGRLQHQRTKTAAWGAGENPYCVCSPGWSWNPDSPKAPIVQCRNHRCGHHNQTLALYSITF